ncbi:MAG: class I SAM-dependent methyltransferase [Dechloromonas sp.]|nr:class I SAM-dependent methyltransferase [Dechloromonas sp.]
MKSAVISERWVDTLGHVHRGAQVESVSGFKVIECTHCQFAHAIPLPTAEELATIYAHDYYTQEKPFYIEHYLEDKDWWDSVYVQRYALLEMHLESKRRSILDVGSGPGLFLAAGRSRGWAVKGIEPSVKAGEYSRNVLGLEVVSDFLTPETCASLGRFDAVNMGEVLEHLTDPKSMLGIASDLLNDGGILCLVVPNDFNPFQMVLRDHFDFSPWWVAPPHHLNYFTPESLRALVSRAGFEVLHVETTFPIDMFLLMGENYIGNSSLGREVHSRRKRFEMALMQNGKGELLTEMYSALSNLNVGREVVLFARKN